jgi:hypothetical protein
VPDHAPPGFLIEVLDVTAAGVMNDILKLAPA